jgi:hypothetical protein
MEAAERKGHAMVLVHERDETLNVPVKRKAMATACL